MAGKKYTRSEITDAVTEKTGMDPQNVRTILDCLLEEIKTALSNNKIIELRGFGTFEVKLRKGREKARNPKTGATVSVDPHGIAIFRAGKALKQTVWDLPEKDTPESEKSELFTGQ
ncbi:MAG: integration host factor subunit beta [Spirochaetaceae bacterium]|jgi:integration host factor subunit beta|nr:integration host factor subunit beta [Spirochaetaceae bacterium]